MPALRTKQELASIARSFAVIRELVVFRRNIYMPVNFLTALPDTSSAPDQIVWALMDTDAIREYANAQLQILFYSDAEERAFKHMLRQFARTVIHADGILVRQKENKVMQLSGLGQMIEVTGEFIPNYVNIPYDPERKTGELFDIIKGWLNSEEQAHSLLYHLATVFQPTWSAVKNVLLIGQGRNGKGTLIKMVERLVGELNISNVTRLEMAGRRPTITSLNGKLLNLVYDGPMDYLKDSSVEKTLVAGEPFTVEIKFENDPVRVQTNALFLEALNKEPKTRDKSPALQVRLARFHFPNKYVDDETFLDKMLSEEMIATFLQLLIEHWVNKDEKGVKLALTVESLDMQMDQVWDTSSILRFLENISTRDSKFLGNLKKYTMPVDTFIMVYREWLELNGYRNMEDDYVLQQLSDSFNMARKTIRVEGRPTSRRCIVGIHPDTLNAINILEQGGSLDDTPEDAAMLSEQYEGD